MKSKLNYKNIWLKDPENHDYPAAKEYLELVLGTINATSLATELATVDTTTKKAKDIFRASGLDLLDTSNFHVRKNVKKVNNHKKLSPLLLVVDSSTHKLIIADGYHRMCAAYYLSEDLDVPCRIVEY